MAVRATSRRVTDALRAMAAGTVVLAGMSACGPIGCSTASCGACIEGMSATLNLACGPANISEVRLTGVCASRDDASASHYVSANDPTHVYVTSSEPGACHVELLFGSGFVFDTDIQFAPSTEGSCSGCNPYPRPQPTSVDVANPPNTCVTVGDASAPADATLSDVPSPPE